MHTDHSAHNSVCCARRRGRGPATPPRGGPPRPFPTSVGPCAPTPCAREAHRRGHARGPSGPAGAQKQLPQGLGRDGASLMALCWCVPAAGPGASACLPRAEGTGPHRGQRVCHTHRGRTGHRGGGEARAQPLPRGRSCRGTATTHTHRHPCLMATCPRPSLRGAPPEVSRCLRPEPISPLSIHHAVPGWRQIINFLSPPAYKTRKEKGAG